MGAAIIGFGGLAGSASANPYREPGGVPSGSNRCPEWLTDQNLFEGEAIRGRDMSEIASDLREQGQSRAATDRLQRDLGAGSDFAQSRDLARQNAVTRDQIRSLNEEYARVLGPYESETRVAQAHVSGADANAARADAWMTQLINSGNWQAASRAAANADYWRTVATNWRTELSNIARRYSSISDQISSLAGRISSLQNAIRANEDRIRQLMQRIRDILGCDDDDPEAPSCPGGRSVPGLSAASSAAQNSARNAALQGVVQANIDRAANGDRPLTPEELEAAIDRYAERENVPRFVREASNPFLPMALAGAALVGSGAAEVGVGAGLGAGAAEGFSLGGWLEAFGAAAAGVVGLTPSSGSGSSSGSSGDSGSGDQSSADGLRATPHCAYGAVFRWDNRQGWRPVTSSAGARAATAPAGSTMDVQGGYMLIGSNCINTRRPLRGSDFAVTAFVNHVTAEQDPAGHDPEVNPAIQIVGNSWLVSWSYTGFAGARASASRVAHTAAEPPRTPPTPTEPRTENGTYGMQLLGGSLQTYIGSAIRPPMSNPEANLADFLPGVINARTRTQINFSNRGRTMNVINAGHALEVPLYKTNCRR